MLASLGWAKVFAWGWGTWSGTTSLFDTQGSAFDDLTLKTLLCGISLLSSDHLDETKATRLLGMRIKHDLALLDVTILLEETSDFRFRKTWVNTSDEKVGAWIDCAVILRSATIILGWATKKLSERPVTQR